MNERFAGSPLQRIIDDLRAVRYTIANKRARDTENRYPEIAIKGITPLGDDALIEAALNRELAHHRQVLADIEKAAAK